MIYLDETTLARLKTSKNLLAFSAGVDSSALFFLLLEHHISFDIALVNYGLRHNAQQEEAHAIALAKQHHLKAFTTQAPQFTNNFEKNARVFRYNFFKSLIMQHHYDNLLTAHQLNDQLEWFLMRLTKGAGTVELMGLEAISNRENPSYTLVRPLLHHSKEELLNYLHSYNYPYFIDESNQSEDYERNRFRKHFSDKLIEEYKEGITRSFDYLKEDKNVLNTGYHEVFHHKELYILNHTNPMMKTRLIDQYLKKLGYLLSAKQRKEIEKEHSLVIGGVWAIEIQQTYIYIAPYQKTILPKKYKEACRLAKVPSKIRGYCYTINLTPTKFEV